MAKNKDQVAARVHISIHDEEIRAMAAIKKVMAPLYGSAQNQVLEWAVQRFLGNSFHKAEIKMVRKEGV